MSDIVFCGLVTAFLNGFMLGLLIRSNKKAASTEGGK